MRYISTLELQEAENAFSKNITEAINSAIRKTGLSRYSVANLAEVSEKCVKNSCEGKNITTRNLAKICRVLDISIFIG